MLNPSEQKILLHVARETLNSIEDGDPEQTLQDLYAQNIPLTPELESAQPCFVTLTTRSGRLRGCIGNTSATQSLFQNVHHMTLSAALQDPRFKPVTRDELSDLHIHISVLSRLQPLVDKEILQIGKHGLFVRHHLGRRGLLLASVAKQYRWSKDEFIFHTCEKAGLDTTKADQYEWFYFEEFSFEEKRA